MKPLDKEKIFSIQRPSSKLLTLYFIRSLFALIAFPFVFVPLLCKYISLRYKFDEEGVSAFWGILFHKQVFLTYARIQDIHVSRGLIERWLRLGTVDIQTASGSAAAELSIVGLEEFEEIRDFLYTRMRGHRGLTPTEPETPKPTTSEALPILLEIRDELRQLREAMARRKEP